MSATERITAEEAAAALRAAAFTVTDPESSEYGRTLTHCFLGGLGADWDLQAALDLLPQADEIAWVNHLLRHDLAVYADGRLHCFDVPAPHRERRH